MKKTVFAATVAIMLTAVPGFAQDTTTSSNSSAMSGMKSTSASERYRMNWVANNADSGAVKRFKAQGFSDSEIKSAANIAFRSGLEVSFVLNQYRVAGIPFASQAAQYNLPVDVITQDLPGYGQSFTGPGSGMSGGMGTSDTSMSSSSMGNGSMSSTMPTVSSSTTVRSTTTTAANGDIIKVALANPNLSTFVKAVQAAGLADTLSGTGPFTVFAPNNDAFAKIPADTLADLLKPENKQKLTAILTYHVVPGKLMAVDVMGMTNPSTPATVNGATLRVKTTAPVTINDANVVTPDVAASNGVIHIIDTVLMPPAP